MADGSSPHNKDMRRVLLGRVFAVAALVGTLTLAAMPRAPKPLPSASAPPKATGGSAAAPRPPQPSPPSPDAVAVEPAAVAVIPDGPVDADLTSPSPPGPPVWTSGLLAAWEDLLEAREADLVLLHMARRLESGKLSLAAVARAARDTALAHRERRRRFVQSLAELPPETEAFATAALASLEHRAAAAGLAERAALTLDESSFRAALREHARASARETEAAAQLMVLLGRYGLPWPPSLVPR